MHVSDIMCCARVYLYICCDSKKFYKKKGRKKTKNKNKQ